MILQLAGVIVLGWLALAILFAIGWSIFMRRSRDIEAHYPVSPRALSAWISGRPLDLHQSDTRGKRVTAAHGEHMVQISSRRRRRRARPAG